MARMNNGNCKFRWKWWRAEVYKIWTRNGFLIDKTIDANDLYDSHFPSIGIIIRCTKTKPRHLHPHFVSPFHYNWFNNEWGFIREINIFWSEQISMRHSLAWHDRDNHRLNEYLKIHNEFNMSSMLNCRQEQIIWKGEIFINLVFVDQENMVLAQKLIRHIWTRTFSKWFIVILLGILI